MRECSLQQAIDSVAAFRGYNDEGRLTGERMLAGERSRDDE